MNADSSGPGEPVAGSEGGLSGVERSEAEPAGVGLPADDPAADEPPDHDLVLATARRIIASDAAIIHRLGTIRGT